MELVGINPRLILVSQRKGISFADSVGLDSGHLGVSGSKSIASVTPNSFPLRKNCAGSQPEHTFRLGLESCLCVFACVRCCPGYSPFLSCRQRLGGGSPPRRGRGKTNHNSFSSCVPFAGVFGTNFRVATKEVRVW